eukprot:189762-Chlamydomonas_euryale.AAC.3
MLAAVDAPRGVPPARGVAQGVAHPCKAYTGARQGRSQTCKVWTHRAHGVWKQLAHGVWMHCAHVLWMRCADEVWTQRAHGVWMQRAHGVWMQHMHQVWMHCAHRIAAGAPRQSGNDAACDSTLPRLCNARPATTLHTCPTPVEHRRREHGVAREQKLQVLRLRAGNGGSWYPFRKKQQTTISSRTDRWEPVVGNTCQQKRTLTNCQYTNQPTTNRPPTDQPTKHSTSPINQAAS